MVRFDSLTEWLDWQEGLHPRSIDLGLERAAGVFKALNPDNVKPLTIIVGGTNGKGSCIAFLEAIYRAQGYRVGAYTSPHILRYNERIRIDGQAVSDDKICHAFERIEAVRNDVSLSYFEFGTLAALDIFWRSELDIQLLEVGLGGRLDAVNIIDADICLITSICIDHIDWLGETREAIGYEKAGIFRTGTPAIIGDLEPPESLLHSAVKKNTPFFCINHDFTFKIKQNGWDWKSKCSQLREYLSLPRPALKGEHQYRNAASVIMTVTQMETLLPVSEKSIYQGLQNVQLKGRFQLIDSEVPVLLDVAHNPHAVHALLDYLVSDFSGKKIYAIFSMMKDKDIAGVIKIINPVIKHWIVAPLNNPRAASRSFMQACFKQCGLENVSFGSQNFSQAYLEAESKAEVGDLILIFGSFFLVSEYLAKASHS
jgi:dihydrofolate synthase/folylpolyglutamate synthase